MVVVVPQNWLVLCAKHRFTWADGSQMAGRVGSTVVVKGKKVRLWEEHGDDPASFKEALAKLSLQVDALRKGKEAHAKSGQHGFRKTKATKG
jgi:ribosome-associated translation inhibitor RaiA